MNKYDHELRTGASAEERFALLRLEQTKLLIPQREIRVLDLTIDVEKNDPPRKAVGWIQFKQEFRPVYCPSAELGWVTYIPDDRPICAVVEVKEQVFGLLCTEVTLLRPHEVVLHEIPIAMHTPHSPIERLAMIADSLACVSSTEKLLAHLNRWEPIVTEHSGRHSEAL